MSAATEEQAERLRLAAILGVAPDELDLGDAPADEVAAYRATLTDLLFEDDRKRLQPTAAAAKVLPGKVLGMIAEHALGPLVCARLAGYMEPERAAGVARSLRPEFLAQVAAEADPRRAVDIIRSIPTDTVRTVARHIGAAGEHVAMGRFVAQLDPEPLAAALEELDDDALVRTGFVLEDKSRLDAVFALLDDERVVRVAERARADGLGPELENLHLHLGPEQLERVRRLGAD